MSSVISIRKFSHFERQVAEKKKNLDIEMTLSQRNSIQEVADIIMSPGVLTPKSVVTHIPTVTSNMKPAAGNMDS